MSGRFQFLFQHWRPLLFGALAGMFLLMGLLVVIGKVPFSYNLRNLAVRWKTALLTAGAFTIVVGLMTVMMAFVNGMYALTRSSAQPGNVIILASGSNDESFSTLAFGDVTNIERRPEILSDDEGNRLTSKEVYVIANQEVPLPDGQPPRRRFVQIRGIENPRIAGLVHNLKLIATGQWFSPAGVEESRNADGANSLSAIQAVLGAGLAEELGRDRPDGKPLQAGDTFVLADRVWKVTGVLNSGGSTFDSEIWAKLQIVGEQFGKRNSYSTFVVRTQDNAAAEILAKKLKESPELSVNALSEATYFTNLDQNSLVLLIAVIIVTVFIAIGGVFGVMNTMFAAISQRMKDIGVLRILGFARSQVLISFLLESLCLALLGGLVGCALGSLVHGLTTKSIVGNGAGGGKTIVLQMRVNLEILCSGLLISLVMGALGGLLPALSAMRLRALETLR